MAKLVSDDKPGWRTSPPGGRLPAARPVLAPVLPGRDDALLKA